jgi:hypothetical protein
MRTCNIDIHINSIILQFTAERLCRGTLFVPRQHTGDSGREQFMHLGHAERWEADRKDGPAPEHHHYRAHVHAAGWGGATTACR